MTLEQLHQIRRRWLLRPEGAVRTPELDEALAEIERLLCEVERLQHCCHELTRQYARLCQENAPAKKISRESPSIAVSSALNSMVTGAS